MLEHVDKNQGAEYLKYIRKDTTITDDEIVEYCHLNDSLGNPVCETYGTMTVSPSSLRYIYHSHLILTHLNTVNLSNIVEVGGGYGGLCLALHFFATKYNIRINSYSIVDLPSIIKLQKLYISDLRPDINVSYIDAETFGKDIPNTDLFLVSNYCFSEIPDALQKLYISNLFPKVAHGFMAWNNIPLYNFGFTTKSETEKPLTGPANKYVYF